MDQGIPAMESTVFGDKNVNGTKSDNKSIKNFFDPQVKKSEIERGLTKSSIEKSKIYGE